MLLGMLPETGCSAVLGNPQTGKKRRILFNGEVVGGSTPDPAAVSDVDGSIMVGARNPGSENFAGAIDEVAIYNRVLSDAEIMRDMEAVGGAAVEASGKLASTWGELKKRN